jgi:hypothetical protein
MRPDATNRSSFGLGIFLGGFVAGVLDIVYAFVLAAMRGRGPLVVLQSVASGLLGSGAYKGGVATGALGLSLHLGITVAAASLYYLAARRSTLMQGHFVACGLLFGVLVYLFMNFVVLPLSAVPFQLKYTPAVVLQGFVSHAVLVGLPIAWFLQHLAFNAAESRKNVG